MVGFYRGNEGGMVGLRMRFRGMKIIVFFIYLIDIDGVFVVC